jgi:hypothetical protein
LAQEQSAALKREIEAIESTNDWVNLGAEQQNALSDRLDNLRIKVSENLDGIQRLVAHQYVISNELPLVRTEVTRLAKANTEPPRNREPVGRVDIELPKEISLDEEVDLLITEIQRLKTKLRDFEKVIVSWI